MTAYRCGVCGRHAAGGIPAPEVRMVLCAACDADLVVWLASGEHVQAWPPLEAARRAAVARGAATARDMAQRVRDRERDRAANAPGRPIDPATRALAAAGLDIIRRRRA